MKHYTFSAIRADGKLETFTAPSLFDPFEIAERMPHSQVYLHLKPRFNVTGIDRQGQLAMITGPAFMLILEGEYYQVEALPTSEFVALKQWQEAKRIAEARRAVA